MKSHIWIYAEIHMLNIIKNDGILGLFTMLIFNLCSIDFKTKFKSFVLLILKRAH